MGNDEASCYVGGLSKDVNEEILEEMFIQVGPIRSFALKRGETHSYALVEFEDEETVPFAIEVLDGIMLFNRPINVKPRNNTKQEENWRKKQQERRYSQPQTYVPQVDSRKRDHNGQRNDPSRNYVLPTPPMPPPGLNPHAFFTPPPMPSAYFTPPPIPTSMQGYSSGSERHDKWHTPPSRDHINPRIPTEYEEPTPRRDRGDRRDYSQSGNRDYNRSDSYDQNRNRSRSDYRNNNGRDYGRNDYSRSGDRRY